ncbi:hypothetical protein K469DRAFT_738270 [Zopfia rhizophila CBS 207.26]|uniref:Uncharacterized protein n=1 Tax=Zopfia rhizophila CBS 207.26 TaxID=1314779 RepID=A0A6A6E5H2_9PEZI|nr:hypothetical protein K469DRAFT_738270 [Zopfia rhizophila CBS 207.26]
MTLKSGNLPRFLAAMQCIYAFPTEPSASPWNPPPATAGHRGRYLWTDAFGVLNFLTLHRVTSQPIYLAHAKSLVSAVHSTLGRTRDLSSHLPGASPSNPLGGGLRIGKEDATGPDGDGQYHHYLTLWMFALNRLATVSGDTEYNKHAIFLAQVIHPHFVYNRSSSRPRIYWKMSTDLKTPLVKSEGNLDPVDGLVTFRLLQQTDGQDSTVLSEEIADYERIVESKWKGYTSSDPLDLGMTLWTAHWFANSDTWARGLAFRDFGTILGIKCALASGDSKWTDRADAIIQTWEDAGVVPEPAKENVRGMNAEDDLLPITEVMYAAALIPGVFQMIGD